MRLVTQDERKVQYRCCFEAKPIEVAQFLQNKPRGHKPLPEAWRTTALPSGAAQTGQVAFQHPQSVGKCGSQASVPKRQ